MILQVDEAGRISIPKPVQERLHLRPGSNLTLEESAEGLLLRPLQESGFLVQRNGLLIHRGESASSLDWDRLLEDERSERIKSVSGL